MDRPAIHTKLQDIFRNQFDDASIAIVDETVARDVKGWNSITHIDLICTVEDEFQIKLSTREVAQLANVGALMDLIQKKTTR